MKVLHIYKTYHSDTRGGIEESIRQICLQTAKAGVLNTVISLSKKIKKCETIQLPECTLIRYPVTFEISSNPVSISLLFDFKKLIKDKNILHYYFPWPFADILHLFAGRKKKYILTYQSDIIKQRFLIHVYSFLMRWFIKKADYITVSSENYFNSSPYIWKFEQKCRIIPLGIDPASYPEVKKNSLKLLDKKTETNFFLFIGVLRYYKGLEYLIKAASGTPFKIIIAGKGPMEQKLKHEVKSLHLESQVIFLGAVTEEEKIALLNKCRAFVFPSHLRSEAFGISLLEAAMCGVPMITCDIGTGTTFINIHENTGIVVEPEDDVQLRAAMNRFYKDQKLAEKMGKNARERFLNVFTADKMGKRFLDIYQKLDNL